MKNYLFLSFFLIFFPYGAHASSVIINEIAWMGSLAINGENATAAGNNEWIELKNLGAASIHLEGWTLVGEDGSPTIMLIGSILPNGFFLLERSDDATIPAIAADMIYVGSLSNAGKKLILKDPQGTIIDSVDASMGWPAGDNVTKETMQKVGMSWITAPSTPRQENAIHGSIGPSHEVFTTPSPVPSSIAYLALTQKIKVYAGEDVFSMVGALLEFSSTAYGINDESIDSSARFFWNFGDGQTEEGREVTHVYRLPGSYMASVHVSSGQYTASDYVKVQIDPNLVSSSGVVLGDDGYLTLTNASRHEIDISSWHIHDNQKQVFIMPAHTLMAPGATISLPNDVTGLLKKQSSLPLVVSYPNNVIAFIIAPSAQTSALKVTQEKQKISNHLDTASVLQGDKTSPRIVVTPHPLSSDSPIFEKQDTKEYATPSSFFMSIPFVIALGMSIFGVISFFVVKYFA